MSERKSYLVKITRPILSFWVAILIVSSMAYLPDSPLNHIPQALADTTGQAYPTASTTAAESPWLDNDWTTPANVYADDGATANVTQATYDTGDQTYVLKATGFDFSAIPDGSTINGVTARVNAFYRSGQGAGSLGLCQLLNTSSAKVGTNNCSTAVALTTTSSTIITKGSTSDAWGNSLTAAWVKNSNFGIALGVTATGANADVDIDYVSLEVTYTPPPTTTIDTASDYDPMFSQTQVPEVSPVSFTTDVFSFQTNTATDAITQLNVDLAASGTPYNGLTDLKILSEDGLTQYYTTISSFTGNSVTFSGGTPITATTTLTRYQISATMKSHSAMPAPAGATYAFQMNVTGWTGSYSYKSGTDSGNSFGFDNLSPASATSTSGSAGDTNITLNWTTSSSDAGVNDYGYDSTVILRWTAASAGAEVPAEGTEYAAGNTISTATVACVIAGDFPNTPLSIIDGTSGSAGCTTSALTNSQAYSYKIFQMDGAGNYDAGVLITGSPFTPAQLGLTQSSYQVFNNPSDTGTNGGPVKIDDASNFGSLLFSDRQTVRSSTGVLYAFLNRTGAATCEIWKSTDGSSWSKPATGIACISGTGVSIAIDGNDDLHLLSLKNGGLNNNILEYRKYTTSNDTFGSPETVTTMANGKSSSIAVDSSNIPHVAAGFSANMAGTGSIKYTNRIGGSWKATVDSFDTSGNALFGLGLAIDNNNFPEIAFSMNVYGMYFRIGNANDATSFTDKQIDSTINITDNQAGSSMAIDPHGNTWVAYVDATTNYITLAKHNSGDAWSVWQTGITSSNVGYEPSIAAVGSDIYVFYTDDNSDIVYEKFTEGDYYFNASVAGPTDPNSVWTDDSLAIDGNTSTYAYSSASGSKNTNYLEIKGTNAPTSGSAIVAVTARGHDGVDSSWTIPTNVSAPGGTWTWTKVSQLESRTFYNQIQDNRISEIYAGGDSGGTALGSFTYAYESVAVQRVEVISTSGETVLQAGTLLDVKAKWAYLNDNQQTLQIDYLYSDNTDVYWASLVLADPPTNVGTSLATQNNAATLATSGDSFRIRALATVSGLQLGASYRNFKLQFGAKNGTCAAATFADVTNSSVIAWQTSGGTDGVALTGADGMTSGNTIVNETYVRKAGGATAFTNSIAAVPAGQDAKFDFALFDNGATVGTYYCFRIINDDGSTTSWTHNSYPEVRMAVAQGITISGSVYQSDESTKITTTPNVKMSIGGAAPTTAAVSNGDFTFSNVTPPAAGTVITLWVDAGSTAGTNNATLVFKYGATCEGGTSSCTGLKLFETNIIIGVNYNNTANTITNANLAACDNDTGSCSDTDIGFTSELSGTYSLGLSWTANLLRIKDTNAKFAPGGAVTMGGYKQSAGTFTGGTASITVNNGAFDLSGGTYTATSGTTTWAGIATNWTISGGTFSANNGSWVRAGQGNISIGSNSFYDATFNSIYNVEITGTMNVSRNFTLTDAGSVTGIIAVKGNVITTDTESTGGGTILFNGTGTQTLSASGGTGEIPGFYVNKTTGTLNLLDTIVIAGSHTNYFNFASGTLNADSSTLVIENGGGPTITPGNQIYNNITFNSPLNLSVSGTFNVDGNLTFTSAGDMSGGAITVAGNISSADSSITGTTTITLDGTGAQTISVGANDLPDSLFTINKASGAATLTSDFSTPAGLTITAGTLSQGATFNLTVNGALTVSADGILTNTGTGDLLLGGDVSNAGEIIMNSNNGTQCVNGNDDITIDSTVDNTTRAWSASGGGTFTMYNVNVDDMTGTGVAAYTSTLSGDTTWSVGDCSVTVIYRSASPGATSDLNTSTRTVTISGTTATFSDTMPNNVGVGDVLQYNPGSGLTLAFISARTSATVFTVQSVTGDAPTAAGANTAVSVFRAYTSLANAEAGIENTGIDTTIRNFDDWTAGGDATTDDVGKDLTAANMQWNIALYANGTTADTQANILGWTTGASNYLKIYTPVSSSEVGVTQRHSGVWDDNKYHLVASAGNTTAIYDYVSYIRITGLQVKTESGADNYPYGIAIGQIGYTTISARISNNIVAAGHPSSSDGLGIVTFSPSSAPHYIWNNIVYGFSGTGNAGIWANSDNGTNPNFVYNNTISNCTSGIGADYGRVKAVNNVIVNTTTPYAATMASGSDYNATDADATTQGELNTPLHDKKLQTFSFVDEDGYDFHLLHSDTAARNYGADLHLDSNLAFASDTDGAARPNSAWDIGADEAATPIYRSASPQATSNLNTGNRTVTISSGQIGSDDFTGVDSTPLADHDARWVMNAGGYVINSNALAGTDSAGNGSMAHWNVSVGEAQYAKGTMGALTAALVGVAVRVDPTTSNGYYYFGSSMDSYFGKLENGSWIDIPDGTSRGSFSQGDTIELRANGSTFRLYKNGSQLGSDITDTTFATGYVGVTSYNSTAYGASLLAQWEGGSLNGNTAVFSDTMPDNVGVGDVLQYNPGSGLALAFISGRISDTVFTVQSATGGTPTAAAAGTAVSVFRAYTSLANAEAGIENTGIDTTVRNFDDWTAGGDAATDDVGKNLITSNQQWNIALYANGTTADAPAVTVKDWTSDPTSYIRIFTPTDISEVGTSQRHEGVWDDSKYHLGNAHGALVWTYIPYTRIDGLQFYTYSWGGDSAIISFATETRISNNIITGSNEAGAGYSIYLAASVDTGVNAVQYVWNNIIYDSATAALYSYDFGYFYNNTIINTPIGIYGYGGKAPLIKNNIVQDSANGYYNENEGGFDPASDFNISEIAADAPNATFAGGQATISFKNTSLKDYHLVSSDAAINVGADLTNDVYISFSTDIDGQTRPTGANTWDIGADEFFGTIITVSGSVYQSNESTKITTTPNVKMSFGGAAATTAAVSTGDFTFTNVTAPTAGTVVTLWVDAGSTAGTNNASLVFKYGSTCEGGTTSCTGLSLYETNVIIGVDYNNTANAIANSDLAALDDDNGTAADTDIGFTSNSGTFTATWTTSTLRIKDANAKFAPGGAVSVKGFKQSDGSFTGNASVTATSSFTQSGGTFNAPTSLTLNGAGFTKSGGTFNEGTGAISFTGAVSSINVATSETFYDFILNKTLGGTNLNFTDSDALTITHDLTLTSGETVGGTYEVQGDVTIGGGMTAAGTSNLNLTSAGAQTITINGSGSAPMLVFDSADDASDNVILNAPSTAYGINITSGFSGTVPFTYNANSLVLGAGGFSQAAGTFTAPSDFTVGGNFIKSGGIFNEGTGNINLTGSTSSIDVVTSETFYNLTLNKSTCSLNLNFTDNDTLIVSNNLTLTCGESSGGGYEVQGNVSIGTGAGGGTSFLKFTGGNDQTYTDGGGNEPDGDITIDKTVGKKVTLASNAEWNATGQDLIIASGTFDQGASYNISTGAVTVDINGTWTNTGTGDIILGGNVSNAGAITLNSNAGAECVDGTDDIAITSSVGGTVRTWSGAGTFTMYNVAVTDQSDGAITITAYTSTLTNADWTVGTCAANFTQSGYRFFETAATTDVGTPLANINTAATLANTGDSFRLRMLVHSQNGLAQSGENFKLQYALKTGETYGAFADVTTATPISYKDNAGLSDAVALTVNANDPTHSTDTVVAQTYEEANTFTNSIALIGVGQDGLWDFALYDNAAAAGATYALRIVKSTGVELNAYTFYPEITTKPSSASTFTQADYGWFANTSSVQPGSALAATNTEASIAINVAAVRLRMSVTVGSENLSAAAQTFILQSASNTDGPWLDVAGRNAFGWGFYNNGSAADGDSITAALLNAQNLLGTYEEAAVTAANPVQVNVGQSIEYDFSLDPALLPFGETFYFRLVKGSSEVFGTYTNYPKIKIGGNVIWNANGGSIGGNSGGGSPATGGTGNTGGGGTGTSDQANVVKSPTSSVNVDNGGFTWSLPQDIYSNDGNYAIANANASLSTDDLNVTGFGFAVPVDSTVNGIKVEVMKQVGLGVAVDNSVKIIKGGAYGSQDKKSGDNWPASFAYVSYGSNADLWGETWTPADINASNFGFMISGIGSGGNATAQIDHVQITVYYSPFAGTSGGGTPTEGGTQGGGGGGSP